MGRVIENNENFQDALAEGRKGELFFINQYERKINDKGLTLVDVSNVWEWCEKDIDFLVKKGHEIYKTIEVKIDKRCDGFSKSGKGPTGNLAYEYVTHDRKGHRKKGWCEKTEADYAVLILCDTNYKENYLQVTRVVWLDMKKWREYKNTHPTKEHVMKEQHPKSEEDVVIDYRHKLDALREFGVVVKENFSAFGQIIDLK